MATPAHDNILFSGFFPHFPFVCCILCVLLYFPVHTTYVAY